MFVVQSSNDDARTHASTSFGRLHGRACVRARVRACVRICYGGEFARKPPSLDLAPYVRDETFISGWPNARARAKSVKTHARARPTLSLSGSFLAQSLQCLSWTIVQKVGERAWIDDAGERIGQDLSLPGDCILFI